MCLGRSYQCWIDTSINTRGRTICATIMYLGSVGTATVVSSTPRQLRFQMTLHISYVPHFGRGWIIFCKQKTQHRFLSGRADVGAWGVPQAEVGPRHRGNMGDKGQTTPQGLRNRPNQMHDSTHARVMREGANGRTSITTGRHPGELEWEYQGERKKQQRG